MGPLTYMRSVVTETSLCGAYLYTLILPRPNCKFLTIFCGNNDIPDLLKDWNFEPNKRNHSSWLNNSNSLLPHFEGMNFITLLTNFVLDSYLCRMCVQGSYCLPSLSTRFTFRGQKACWNM